MNSSNSLICAPAVGPDGKQAESCKAANEQAKLQLDLHQQLTTEREARQKAEEESLYQKACASLERLAADAAQKARAEMQDAGNNLASFIVEHPVKDFDIPDAIWIPFTQSHKSTAGSNYIHKSALKEAADALKLCVEVLNSNHSSACSIQDADEPHCDCGFQQRHDEALSAAEKFLKG